MGDTAQAKLEEAQLKRLQADAAQAAGDNERAAQLNAQADQLFADWGENGTKRLAAHTAIGALTGGTQGATGAAVGTLSAPAVASALENAGLDDTLTDGLTAIASTAAGAATGGTQGGAAAFNEVKNNYLRHDQVDAYIDELEGCVARGDCDEVQEKFRALSIAQQDELIALCATDAEACTANYQSLVEDGEQFRDALNGFSGGDIPWQLGLDAGPLLSQYMEAEAIVSQEGFAQYLQEQHGLDVEQASVLSAVAAGVLGANSRVKPINGRIPINSKYANTTVPLEDLPEGVRQKYPHSVPFNGAGFPDFSRYSIRNVRIEPGSSRNVDFRRADRKAGFDRSNPRPEGYTWHHHQDTGYMQLVPSDLHDAIRHTGGIATSK